MTSLSEMTKQVEQNFAPSNEVVSQRIRFTLPGNSKRLVVDRKQVTLNPQNSLPAAISTTSQQVRFYVSGNNYLDGPSIHLTGRLKTNLVGNGDRPFLPYGVFSCIKQIRLLSSSGETIEDINNFHLLAATLHKICIDKTYGCTTSNMFLMNLETENRNVTVDEDKKADEMKSIVGYTTTSGTHAQVNNVIQSLFPPKFQDLQSKKFFGPYYTDFTVPLCHVLGLFKQEKYLPLSPLGRLEVEITFLPCEECFSNNNNVPLTYSIDNLQLSYDVVRLNDILSAKILDKIKDDGLRIAYTTYHSSDLNIGTNTSANFAINKSASDVLSCFAIMRDNSNSTGIVNNKFTWTNGGQKVANAVTIGDLKENLPVCPTWSFRLGSDQFPVNPCNSYAKSMHFLSDALGREMSLDWGVLTMKSYMNEDFTIGINLEADSNGGGHFTGRSVTSGSNLTLEISNLDGALAKTIYSFMLYTRILVIKDNQNVVIEE